jgi:hypothetical protein
MICPLVLMLQANTSYGLLNASRAFDFQSFAVVACRPSWESFFDGGSSKALPTPEPEFPQLLLQTATEWSFNNVANGVAERSSGLII